jgi:hypothetical protein
MHMAQDIEVITADLMQQSEAAAELHVHLSTLRRWEAVDQGPPRIKIGRKVFYRRSSLRNWLLAHESVQPSGAIKPTTIKTAARYAAA